MSKNQKKKKKFSFQQVFAVVALILMIGLFISSLMMYM